MKYKEIEGNLITLALEGEFDVIAHGCNCFCTMGGGLAPQMAEAFGADTFEYEGGDYIGDINKLGTIDFEDLIIEDGVTRRWQQLEIGQDHASVVVVNCYTQYGISPSQGQSVALDYEALTLCLRKINKTFSGQHIGLPLIGTGIAQGSWCAVKAIIKAELTDMDVTIVHYT